MEIIKKISKAKSAIKQTKLKKEGKNSFSNYEYFTPSQIEFLVNQVCDENGLMTTFDLIRNELGVYGLLTVYDCDSDEKLEYKMATAIPEIKATNIAQQLGGCVTYTERYLKMSAFGITDNKLDFDTTENTKSESKQQEAKQSDANFKGMNPPTPKPFLSEEGLTKAITRTRAGEAGIWENLNKAFNLTPAQTARFTKEIQDKELV